MCIVDGSAAPIVDKPRAASPMQTSTRLPGHARPRPAGP